MAASAVKSSPAHRCRNCDRMNMRIRIEMAEKTSASAAANTSTPPWLVAEMVVSGAAEDDDPPEDPRAVLLASMAASCGPGMGARGLWARWQQDRPAGVRESPQVAVVV